MSPLMPIQNSQYYCVQRKRWFSLPTNPWMTQVLRHPNTNSTHSFKMFSLRSVLLLRSPWCVCSLSLSAHDRSQKVHAVAYAWEWQHQSKGLFCWDGNLVSYSSNHSSVTGLVCGFGQTCSLPTLGPTQACPTLSRCQQTVAAQGLGSVVHEALHNKDSMLEKSFFCSNTLSISGNSSLNYEGGKIQSVASLEFLKLT